MNILLFFKRYKSVLRWLPALCFAIAIFNFSATPGDELEQSYHSITTTIQTISTATTAPSTTPWAVPTPSNIDWLKVGHVIGYFGLGFTVLYAMSAHSRWNPSIALILCCLYSFTDEFHQIFTPGRSASPRDLLIDTLAALIGVTIMLGVIASRKHFEKNL